MKENKYDDAVFFASYAKMPRSLKGLEGAGEWPILQRMLGHLEGKAVLDLGCGYGWHCRYAMKSGASRTVGVDLSEKMIARAREFDEYPSIEYHVCGIEDFESESNAFDVVVSSLAFHYIADLAAIFQRIFAWLRNGGRFVFSIEHPVFTAAGRQDWHYDSSGNPQHWPVDRYFEEGPRETQFIGHSVLKYHRPLATLIGALTDAGFVIETLEEPSPSAEVLAKYPDWKDESRRPLFLLLAACKT